MARKTATSAIGIQRERRAEFQQKDLFSLPSVTGAPDWPDLPKQAREALISLMTRLILEHAQVAAPTTAGTGHER